MVWFEKPRDSSREPLIHDNAEPIGERPDFPLRVEIWQLRSQVFVWRSVSLLCIILFVFHVAYTGMQRNSGTFESGYDTEFADAARHIRVEKTRFGSVLTRDEHGTWRADIRQDEPTFAGPPSYKIDMAWNGVLGAQYIPLTESEVNHLNEDPDHKPVQQVPSIWLDNGIERMNLTSGKYTTIGVVHQLHCLNMLRKHIDADYYGNAGGAVVGMQRAHLDHCVDTVRQALMCWGDITPVPMVPWPEPDGSQIVLADTERPRTCRNSRKIIDYTRWRGRVLSESGELMN